MCLGSKAPSPPPKLPEAPVPPAGLSEAQTSAEDRRKRAAAGASSTILTGPQGVTTQAQTSQKTLLGA